MSVVCLLLLEKQIVFGFCRVKMFSAARHAVRASYPRTSVLLRYCSAQVGSKEYFDKLVANNKVVVFMKGTPDMPRCGFSNAVVQILRMHGVDYNAHNVLADDNVRQGIKEYSEWPTIPQIYVSGEFIGGCDILLQMHQNGELIEELQKVGITSALLEAENEDDKGNKNK